MSSVLSKFLGGEAPETTARTIADCDAITITCELKDREDLKANNPKAYLTLKSQCEEGIEEKFEFHDFSELTINKQERLRRL